MASPPRSLGVFAVIVVGLSGPCGRQMLRYESAARTRGTEARLRALTSCLQSHFSPDPELTTQTELVRQQIDLIGERGGAATNHPAPLG